ncbi:hypothetical protein [Castellaniella sp.]
MPTRVASQWPYKGPLMRLNIGLESSIDLIADLKTGFTYLSS